MKKKILIVDDYFPILDSLRILLELNDYEVEIAQNGLNILDKNIKPDLLLIDYHIPGLDVDNILKQVKNHSVFKSIPTLLMSGHVNLEHFAARCGTDDFIAKPLNLERLLNKIKILCLKNAKRELNKDSDN